MPNNSDELYEKYRDYDFTDAKPVSETPHLAKLQAQSSGKSRITIRVDNEVLAFFKARAAMENGSYQTMMNEALKQFMDGLKLTDVVRQAVHDAMERP
jgi:uncharacterized protein (DUF4415 family)